jgi:enamine deaminase RidA (YjgF/YER057c/UK114 family)
VQVLKEGKVAITGQLGKEASLEKGQEAAKICAIYILAQLHDALTQHNLKVKQCVKVNGYVSSTAYFSDHPKVMNGASDLLVQVLGDEGKHAQAAVGVSSLPLSAAVEVEAIFEVE